MKLDFFLRPSVATAAVIAPSLVHGGAFGDVLRLALQAKEEVTKLAVGFDSTYAKFSRLMEQLTRCEVARERNKNQKSDFDGNVHRYEAGVEDYHWTPKAGDSWNYNLHAPVEIAADADVVFIDMGELVEGACFRILVVPYVSALPISPIGGLRFIVRSVNLFSRGNQALNISHQL